MNPELLRPLLVVAVVLGAVLLGMSLDRLVVGFPAWRRVGVGAYGHSLLRVRFSEA
jgi:hypothetical protein